MHGLVSTALAILAGILLYRFRAPLLDALKRFDAANVARRAREVQDRRDRFAHYKHTLELAEQQVEDVGAFETQDSRTGQKVMRYTFEGEQFLSCDEAEAARQRAIVAKARAFYEELPAALAHRRKETLN